MRLRTRLFSIQKLLHYFIRSHETKSSCHCMAGNGCGEYSLRFDRIRYDTIKIEPTKVVRNWQRRPIRSDRRKGGANCAAFVQKYFSAAHGSLIRTQNNFRRRRERGDSDCSFQGSNGDESIGQKIFGTVRRVTKIF
jgi:hypothetical protein